MLQLIEQTQNCSSCKTINKSHAISHLSHVTVKDPRECLLDIQCSLKCTQKQNEFNEYANGT